MLTFPTPAQNNGVASIAAGEITPQAVQNAIFGFNQAPTAGRHLLQSATVKVPCLWMA